MTAVIRENVCEPTSSLKKTIPFTVKCAAYTTHNTYDSNVYTYVYVRMYVCMYSEASEYRGTVGQLY